MQFSKNLILILTLNICLCAFAEASREIQVYNSVKQTDWFFGGKRNAPHSAYVVMEPNCYYCHRMFISLLPYLNSGQFSARWVVGAFSGASSKGKAAAILKSRNPYKSLKINEEQYDKIMGQGGITGDPQVDQQIRARLNRNNRFISRFGLGTPLMIYRDREDKIHVVEGLLGGSTLENIISEMKPFADK